MTMPSSFPTAPGVPGTDPNAPPATGTAQPGVVVNVPPPAAPPATPMSAEQFEAMLNAERERVRKEEKDKLYPQIQTLNEQLQVLSREREERLAAQQQAEQEAAELAKQKAEEEMTARDLLRQYQTESEQRFNELLAERDRERALREKEGEFARVAEYRFRRLAEESDTIAPQLADYVGGASEEEIDRSIALAQQKTAAILAEVQQAQVGQRRSVAPPVSGMPPVDMTGGGEQQRALSADDIRNMSVDEYAQLRPQLLGAASQRVREQGPYAP